MQTHKRLIARILSLVLTSSMVLTTLPLNVLASEELSNETEIIQEKDKENSGTGGGVASVNTDVTGGETTGLGVENTDAGNETVDTTLNDYDLAKIEGDVEIDDTDKGSCEKDPHEISGKTETHSISVTGGTHWIKLNGVNIDVPSDSYKSAFAITTATVHLELADGTTNILRGADYSAGLEAPEGTTLNINGNGTLNATGRSSGAGIGGSQSQSGGTITINGGTISAFGGANAAGIGGGGGGAGGTITINGGTVSAISGSNATGIGAGNSATGGTVSIKDGTTVIAATFTEGKDIFTNPAFGNSVYMLQLNLFE